MGKCQLCLQEKKLIKAHIIPEFLYRDIKDENNVLYKSTYNLDTLENKTQKIQTGEFDKDILCQDCDNRILGSTYERYAQSTMFGSNLNPEIAPICNNFQNPADGAEYSICTNIDYGKMKLFLLSILWRASITKRKIFKDVSLGKKHEERIRYLLHTGNVPSEQEYPVVITSLMRTKNKLKNVIGQPKRVRFQNGLNAYIFMIHSIQFLFLVNAVDHRLPDFFTRIMLKESGEMTILHVPKGRDMCKLPLIRTA